MDKPCFQAILKDSLNHFQQSLKLSSLILPSKRRDLAKGVFNMEGPSLITSDGTTSKPLNYTTQGVAMVS